MNDKNKLCPFCGNDKIGALASDTTVCIACDLCKSRGPEFEHANVKKDNFSFQEALEMSLSRWNHRSKVDKEMSEIGLIFLKDMMKICLEKNVDRFLYISDLIQYLHFNGNDEGNDDDDYQS